jgi:hypothetical protein
MPGQALLLHITSCTRFEQGPEPRSCPGWNAHVQAQSELAQRRRLCLFAEQSCSSRHTVQTVSAASCSSANGISGGKTKLVDALLHESNAMGAGVGQRLQGPPRINAALRKRLHAWGSACLYWALALMDMVICVPDATVDVWLQQREWSGPQTNMPSQTALTLRS